MQERRSSRLKERSSLKKPKRNIAPSRKRSQNVPANGNNVEQLSVERSQETIQNTQATNVTSSVNTSGPVNTAETLDKVVNTVNTLAASVMSMQQQITLMQTNSYAGHTGIPNTHRTDSEDVSRDTVPSQPSHTIQQGGANAQTFVTDNIFDTSGTNNSESNNSDVPSLQQALPLGSMVSDSIKNKIWSNEYVDLGLLLPKNNSKSKGRSLIIKNLDVAGGTPQLAIQGDSEDIKYLEQWISAFSIYMAIYCEKFKDSAPDLLKYMTIVRDIAKKKGDWAEYDMEFRKSKCQLKVSWANIHHELWLSKMLKENNEKSNN